MTLTAAGADYSTLAVHLALVDRDRVLEVVCVPILDLSMGAKLDAISSGLAGIEGAHLLALEEPWARADKGIRTALSIHRIAAWVECLAWTAGYEVERVAVPTWRSAILGVTPTSKEAKRASIAYVRRVYGHETKDHNEADAICLASWALSQARIRKAGR